MTFWRFDVDREGWVVRSERRGGEEGTVFVSRGTRVVQLLLSHLMSSDIGVVEYEWALSACRHKGTCLQHACIQVLKVCSETWSTKPACSSRSGDGLLMHSQLPRTDRQMQGGCGWLSL